MGVMADFDAHFPATFGLGADTVVLPVMGGSNKPLFMHQAGDILIDDFRRNTEAWAAAGGRAILHRNFPDTMAQLRAHLAKGDSHE